MRKIAFIVSSLDTGGAQRAVSNIVTNWPDDWEIDIILNNAAIIKYPYKGNIIDLRTKEQEKYMVSTKGFFKKISQNKKSETEKKI